VASPDGVSNDVLAERIADLRGDVAELSDEMHRSRTRLHNVEGLTGALVSMDKARQREARERQHRIELRLQILAALVAVAALAEPFLLNIRH
jgi:hypothetical protein